MTTGLSPKRFSLAVSAVLALVLTVWAAATGAEYITFMRIGTGATGGSYFPIGGIIANAISKPPGSLECRRGGSCGVPGLIATAVATEGSVANVAAVADGDLEMALTQAHVAYYAYTGTGMFAGRAMPNLRALGNLFPETLHVVVDRRAGIEQINDLAGKRVSLGPEGSGSLATARIVLNAFGVGENDMQVSYKKVGRSADLLAAGELDAFFAVGGAPITAVRHMADTTPMELLPVMGKPASVIRMAHPFLGTDVIAADTYPGAGAVVTVKVGAQLIIAEDADDELVTGILRALWHPTTRKLLSMSHPVGEQMELHNAMIGIAIPLHPAAERFYREVGFTFPEEELVPEK